jgi:hypothetical protein
MSWNHWTIPSRFGLVALACVAAPAFAQDSSPDVASDVRLRFEKASRLSGSEQIKQSDRFLKRMKAHLRRGFELLEQARTEKDIVKLNCVNERLASIKGLLKISEQADIALQEAVSRRDKESGDHEFTKISIAYQKVESLGVEVENCAGEALRYSGDTRVEVNVEGVPEEDTTQPTIDEIVDSAPPAASPLQ